MRRTGIWLVGLAAIGVIAPASAIATPGVVTAHTPLVIHQHLIRHGRSAVVTHSGSTREFNQNLVGAERPVPVTSSTGKPLYLGVYVDQFGGKNASETDLEISVGDDAGQSTLWDITVGDRGMIFDPLSGHGTIAVGSKAFAPYGAVHLTITPAGPTTTSDCAKGGTSIVRPVTIRGTIDFNTQYDVWGTVGDPVNQVVFDKKTYAETDSGPAGVDCEPYVPYKCAGGIDVNKGGLDRYLDAETYRRGGQTYADMSFHHESQPPDGVSGFIDDFVYKTIPVPMVLHRAHHPSVTFDAGDDGLITGSATWTTVGKAQVEKGECRGGVTKSWAAKFVNGADPLTASLSSGGTFTFPDNKRYSYLDADPLAPSKS